MEPIRFTADLWRHPGEAAWHFVTLPEDLADELRARFEGVHRPFGSIGVRATVGSSTWRTSLFADTERGSYLLPVKAAIRRREGLADGDALAVRIELGEPRGDR